MIANNGVSIYALGGLGEVGKNCYCIESDKSLIIIDCGVRFPGNEYPGIDYLIPSFDHLKNVNGKIKGLFITHGHEDHIGAIPYLVNKVNIPVIYAPKLAVALIRKKLEDFHCEGRVKLEAYDEKDTYQVGEFMVSFFRVTHSIPDSFGIVCETPEGVIATTGDFKIDLTPIGPDIELNKIAQIGNDGVDLLLSDSTNAENDGYTPSEKNVYSSIEDIFKEARGRLIVSTFSSNVSRIQQILTAAVKFKRKIAVVGRSMNFVINVARELGYVSLKDADIIEPIQIKDFRQNEILILCTGSQGEPMAALSRIASGVFPDIRILPGDTVVFSSSAIPGNGVMISYIVNQLARAGADVITNSILSDIHSSGHPAKVELTLMLKLMKPKYFMPVHGEYRMLKIHGEVAEKTGIDKSHIFILENGNTLRLKNHSIEKGDDIPASVTFIDGNGMTNHIPSLVNDRKRLEDDGLIGIIYLVDEKNKVLLKEPEIVLTGFSINSQSNLVNEIKKKANELASFCFKNNISYQEGKKLVSSEIEAFLRKNCGKYPMVIPMILTN